MRYWLFLCLTLVSSCANLPPPTPNTPEAHCLALYKQADRILKQSTSLPSSPRHIAGFPYYRIDRFFAEFRLRDLNPSQTAHWLQTLSELDLQTRQIAGQTQLAELKRCAKTLRAFDLMQPQRLDLLKKHAEVPDDYITAARIIGLYPLMSLPVHGGIKRLHEEFRQTFVLPLASLPVQGQLSRYRLKPERSPQISNIKTDLLGIPSPTSGQWQDLFARHAPVWEIDVTAEYDRPGRPVWYGPKQPGVDVSEVLTFYYPSYAWWQGQPVLQLNYLIWFDQRPLTGPFDILGGALDAVLWRVTLNAAGEVFLYDSIHACGCYHLFFPASTLRLKPEALALSEPPFVAQTAPVLEAGQSLVIRIASATHYIERIYADSVSSSEQTYQLVDYAELYQTPMLAGESRSLFGPDGIVSGSERAERALLWPLGVPEPGAMRERGRHAVAFVGRRHFDDAELLDMLFEPSNRSHRNRPKP